MDRKILCGLEFYWQERSWLGNLYMGKIFKGGILWMRKKYEVEV